MQTETVSFKRILGNKGGTLGVTIPPELLDFLNAKEQDVLILQSNNGKKGKYLTLWLQENEEDVLNESTTNLHQKT